MKNVIKSKAERKLLVDGSWLIVDASNRTTINEERDYHEKRS